MFRVKASRDYNIEQVPVRLLDVFNFLHLNDHAFFTVPDIVTGVRAKCRVDLNFAAVATQCRELETMGAVTIVETGIATQAPAPAPAAPDDDDDEIIPLDGIYVDGSILLTCNEPDWLRGFNEWIPGLTLKLDYYVDMLFERARAWDAISARRALAAEGLTEFDPDLQF